MTKAKKTLATRKEAPGYDVYDAIFEFQQEIGKIRKNAENPFHKSKYATLDAIWEAIHPILSKYGLLVMQPTERGSAGTVLVGTVVCHVPTKTETSCVVEMPLAKMDPQAVGSAITYGRRYTLSTILGLQTEFDDDGNAATGLETKRGGRRGGGKADEGARKDTAEEVREERVDKMAVLTEFVGEIETVEELKAYYKKNASKLTSSERATFKKVLGERKAEIEGEE